MIPILFDENEKKFITNGIGRISDAISCKVTEERNGIYELKMEYPITGKMFAELKYSRIIYATPSDGNGEQPFRIYKITKPMSGRIEVFAEHISYQMLHIPVVPFKANSAQEALLGLKSNAVEGCPFEFWTDKSTIGTFEVKEPANMRSKLVGNTGSVLDVYGGELEFDKYKVSLHNKRGADNGVSIRYGKNLTDLKQEENIQNTITGIVPYYKDSDGNILMLPEKTVSAENASNYPYNRTVPIDFSSKFEETPTIEQLREAAVAYVKNNGIGVPKVSITVSFQQLWQTEEYARIAPLERIHLCDTVSISYEKLGVSASAKVNKTVYNVLLERYDSIELGDAKSGISDRIIEQNNKIEEKPTLSFLEQAILNATEQITGIKGGYIVFRYDANKQPYEMLIMDTPEIEKAKNIWRFNQGGLGHSSNGYEGPYTTAITQDGKIVADFIATGTLMAGLIKAGILSDAAGKNYWNIETGELVTKNIKAEGGSILASLIKAGILSDAAGKNYWNMETGELVTRNIKVEGGEILASLIKTGILADDSSKNFWNLDTGEFVTKDITIQGGKIQIETDTAGDSIIAFRSGSNLFKIRPSGFELNTNIGARSGMYYMLSSAGIEMGRIYYPEQVTNPFEIQATAYQPLATLGENSPTFTFQTADGHTVSVVCGIIDEVN